MTASPTPSQPVSDADRELLTAYIDQQLSAAEQRQLEQRLEVEPLLRQELEEIQTTVALLRGLPVLQLPRSFILDPDTAPRRRGFWLGWQQQLLPISGGLVGIMLVILFSLSLAGNPVSTVFSNVNSGLAGDSVAAEPPPPEVAALEATAPADAEAADEAAGAAEMAEAPAAGAAAPQSAEPPMATAADGVAAADVPPAVRMEEPLAEAMEEGETTAGAAQPGLLASPAPLATSERAAPDTLDFQANEATTTPSTGPGAAVSTISPALIGAGIAAAGILIGIWLARWRRQR